MNLRGSELFQLQKGHIESYHVAIVVKGNKIKDFLTKESVVDCHCAQGTGLEDLTSEFPDFVFHCLQTC